ncbi:MAG: tetratricopeptide repeat protein, partial [Verrucomicrobiota bacterium]|nr:tetratricopeptide repeat protein [Verrucomicrobiota bacterium]
MIDAFTRLKDYPAAVEQHIEIINRKPEDEENIENAINYVKRYGGGDVLLAYYQKTAAEAYKNYRWNVILAKIYEANNDLETAVQNYKTAIENQPEMTELYLAVSDIETRRTNYDAALENINKVLELSNDNPTYIKQKIAMLDKAGRTEEAAAERARLPVRERPKQTVSDQFQAAQNRQAVEQSQAVVTYREAFEKLLEKPLSHDLTAADVSGYVESVRTEENLDVIAEKLWTLRDEFVAAADGNNVINAAKARNQRQTLDGAMPEAIGKIAKTTAASDVNSALQKDLSRRIDEVFKQTDRNTTLSLIQNIAHQAGFGALEETILIRQKDKAFGDADDFHPALRRLLNFYGERGMFQKVTEVLDEERNRDKYPANLDYPRLIAENARLIGDKDRELTALRESYQSASGKITTDTNNLTARYLEFLYQNNRAELAGLTKKYSPYQLQLINFLLAKGERELAHEAIANAGQPQSWKLARNAETSLALREYSDKDECYFCDALRLAPIGAFIAQRPDKASQLVGDEWFRLVSEYGEWLYFAPNDEMKTDAQKFTPAMIENHPNSADEQARLGAFYLAQKDAKNAFEYLRVAAEMKPGDKNVKANLGAVYFQTGEPEKAREIWEEIIAGENASVEDGELYLQTLREYGLAAEAREKLFSSVAKHLKENDHGTESYY